MGILLALCAAGASGQRVTVTRPAIPVIAKIEKVAQLPRQLPQRINAITFHHGKLWLAIYAAGGKHIRYDPITGEWDFEIDGAVSSAIQKLTNGFGAGGWAFVDDRLWVGAANHYASIYGWASLRDRNLIGQMEKSPADEAGWQDKRRTHAFTDLTYDGTHIWASWNVCEYSHPVGEVQRLLKIDKDTGEILESFPLPYGSPADLARGLAWDGQQIWYAYDSHLLALDARGNVLGHYELNGVRRTAGLAWDGESLWVAEFEGQLWRIHSADLPVNN